MVWGAELSSGHGAREVKTTMQLSDKPLVDHVVFDTGTKVIDQRFHTLVVATSGHYFAFPFFR